MCYLLSAAGAGVAAEGSVVVVAGGASTAGAGGGLSVVFNDGVLAGGGRMTAGSSFLPQAETARVIRVRAISDFFMDFPLGDGGAFRSAGRHDRARLARRQTRLYDPTN